MCAPGPRPDCAARGTRAGEGRTGPPGRAAPRGHAVSTAALVETPRRTRDRTQPAGRGPLPGRSRATRRHLAPWPPSRLRHADTTWDADNPLETQERHNLELEARDGIKRRIEYDWTVLARLSDNYRRSVEGEIARLGLEHPTIQTQYSLKAVEDAGKLFSRQVGGHAGRPPRRGGRPRGAVLRWRGRRHPRAGTRPGRRPPSCSAGRASPASSPSSSPCRRSPAWATTCSPSPAPGV